MHVVARQVRAVMQKKLCRPVPLETIGTLTVATLRELAAEAGSKGGRPAAQAAPADDSAAEEASAPAQEAPGSQAQAAAPAVETSKKVQAPSPVAPPQKAETGPESIVVAQQAVVAPQEVEAGKKVPHPFCRPLPSWLDAIASAFLQRRPLAGKIAAWAP